MYDLRPIIDVDAVAAVDPGTTLLISGATMLGKDDLLRELLASGARQAEGIVVVTTNDDATAVLADLEQRAPEAPGHHLCAIDCRSDGGRTTEETPTGSSVQHVSGPGDMTGLGVSITKSFERLRTGGLDSGRFGFSSLSTVLTYTNRETVFKFCHVLSSRLDTANFLGVFTIDSSAHDEQTLQVVKQPFDGMIEIRERDGQREARVRGIVPEPSAWIDLDG